MGRLLGHVEVIFSKELVTVGYKARPKVNAHI